MRFSLKVAMHINKKNKKLDRFKRPNFFCAWFLGNWNKSESGYAEKTKNQRAINGIINR